MSPLLMYAADAVLILTLVTVFVRRHGRRELIAAYLGVNVGVLAVAATLATSTVNAGLGLGLFGILSIIRLRSEELAQHEVAYYFAALALGLISGLSTAPTLLHALLMAVVVVALWLGDHPRLAKRTSRQELLLDRALTDPEALTLHVTTVLGRPVSGVTVVKTDLVNDTTLVSVRVAAGPAPVPPPAADQAVPADELVGTRVDAHRGLG